MEMILDLNDEEMLKINIEKYSSVLTHIGPCYMLHEFIGKMKDS